jgi:hypothetical protein
MEKTIMPRNSRDDRDRDDDRDSRSSRGRDRDDDRGRSRDRDDDRGRSRDRDDDDRGSRRGGGDYEYAGRSSEENTKRAKQGSARYDSIFNESIVYYSAKVGENCVRIVPWLNKKFDNYEELKEKYGSHWGIDAVIHRNVGPDNGTYLCLDKMFGLPCPMCDAYNDGEEDFKPSDRMLCWVIDRNDEKAGPKLWNMPLGSSKDIQAASQVKKTGEWLPVEHPEEGYDIYFIRDGEKDRTRYKQFELDRDPSPLSEKPSRMEDWMGQVMEKPLPDYLKSYDAEHIEKVLSGKRRSKDDEDGGGRDDRRRDRDDDRGSSRRSRDRDDDRGRDRDRDRDDDRGERRRRPSSRDDDDNGTDAEFTRPARRRGGDDDGKADNSDDGDSRASRGRREEKDEGSSRRGRGRDDSPTDASTDKDDPPPRSRRRGDDDKYDGQVERHRSARDEPDKDDDNGDDDGGTKAAKENLKRVGRRGGR